MKKIIMSLMVLAAISFIASTGFAAGQGMKSPTLAVPSSTETMIGKVVYVNKGTDSVVVKDEADNQNKIVYTSPEMINTLKPGETIKLELTGPGETDSIRILHEPMKSRGPDSYGYGDPWI